MNFTCITSLLKKKVKIINDGLIKRHPPTVQDMNDGYVSFQSHC